MAKEKAGGQEGFLSKAFFWIFVASVCLALLNRFGTLPNILIFIGNLIWWIINYFANLITVVLQALF